MWLGQANNLSMYRKWEFFLGQNQADSASKFQPGPTENSSEPGQPEGPEDFKHCSESEPQMRATDYPK